MTRLADPKLSPPQALACGRVFDSISGEGVDDFEATLAYAHSGGSGSPPVSGGFPLLLGHRADGWFVLSLRNPAQMPDLSTAPMVTLTLRVAVPAREPVEVTRDVPGDRLAVVTATLEVGDATVTAPAIPDAPWSFDVPLDPRPVALAGIVLREHDPEAPAAGVSVGVSGTSTVVVTDTGGRFFVPDLPVQVTVTLTLDEGAGPQQTRLVRLDYDQPVNLVTLSLPL